MSMKQYKFPESVTITMQAQAVVFGVETAYCTYLLHFTNPVIRRSTKVRHYIGMTNNLARRMTEHKNYSNGSGLVKKAIEQGEVIVVAIWPQDGNFEQLIKSRRNHKRLCPICRAEGGYK